MTSLYGWCLSDALWSEWHIERRKFLLERLILGRKYSFVYNNTRSAVAHM